MPEWTITSVNLLMFNLLDKVEYWASIERNSEKRRSVSSIYGETVGMIAGYVYFILISSSEWFQE